MNAEDLASLETMVPLFRALDNLQSKADGMARVLREEAEWWKAGCPPRDEARARGEQP